MASRQIDLPEFGKVLLTKRKGARSLRLSVDHNGQLRVSLPQWAPYQAGIDFAKAKSDWVLERQRLLKPNFYDGQAIGKAHHLRLSADLSASKVTSRLKTTEAYVSFPAGLNPKSPEVQQAAQTVSQKALRSEAEQLLPQRLQQLASQHGFNYGSVRIRHLKSRWGSCSSKGDITLNLFLMQLSWRQIDYVLLHELVHTKVLRHVPPFWEEFGRHLPEARQLSREVSRSQPKFSSTS